MEIWKDINEFKGLYQVSNLGNVRGVERIVKSSKGNKQILKAKITKQFVKQNNYLVVNLSKNSKSYSRYVHRLVAIAFIDNPLNKPTVNHIDCNVKNNYLYNLEWCTYKEQENHKLKLGRRKQTNNKKVRIYYLNGEVIDYESVTKCSKELKINRDTVYNILNKLKSNKQTEFKILNIVYLD